MLGWPAGQVRLQGDRFVLGDGSAAPVAFDEVAERILRGGVVETDGSYDSAEHEHEDGADAGFCAYMVEVDVDPETGEVRPVDAVLVAEVGTVINPIGAPGSARRRLRFRPGQRAHGGAGHRRRQGHDPEPRRLQAPDQADVPPLRTVLAQY